MSDLLKKLESTETLLKDKSDQCEVLLASVEAVKAEKAQADEAIAGHVAEIEALKASSAKQAEELKAANDALEAAKAEVETIKARLALTPVGELGEGDPKAAGAGVASDPVEPVDHMAVYNKISDAKARMEYRQKFRKELGLK